MLMTIEVARETGSSVAGRLGRLGGVHGGTAAAERPVLGTTRRVVRRCVGVRSTVSTSRISHVVLLLYVAACRCVEAQARRVVVKPTIIVEYN